MSNIIEKRSGLYRGGLTSKSKPRSNFAKFETIILKQVVYENDINEKDILKLLE